MSDRKSQTDSETFLMSTTNSLNESNDTLEKRHDDESTIANSLLRDRLKENQGSDFWLNRLFSWCIPLLLISLVLALIIFICINVVYVVKNEELNEIDLRIQENGEENIECGQATVLNRFRRIIGGSQVHPHTWPWLVSIRLKINSSEHQCGGSLIDDEFVLTASHCLSAVIRAAFHYKINLTNIYNLIEVYIGVHDNSEISYQDDRVYKIKYFDIHDEFKSYNQSLMNDIAIIKLERKVVLRDRKVGLVCLPRLVTSKDSISINDTVIAVGWGANDLNHSMPSHPYQASFNILDPYSNKCNQGSIGYSWDKPNMYCAHSIDVKIIGTCFGDSGGPIVAFKNRRWILVGIASFGHLIRDSKTKIKRCDATKPSYFVKVSSYLDWIYKHTNSSKYQINNDDLVSSENDSQGSLFE